MVAVTDELVSRIKEAESLAFELAHMTKGGRERLEMVFSSSEKFGDVLELMNSGDVGPYFDLVFQSECVNFARRDYDGGSFSKGMKDNKCVLVYTPKSPGEYSDVKWLEILREMV